MIEKCLTEIEENLVPTEWHLVLIESTSLHFHLSITPLVMNSVLIEGHLVLIHSSEGLTASISIPHDISLTHPALIHSH